MAKVCLLGKNNTQIRSHICQNTKNSRNVFHRLMTPLIILKRLIDRKLISINKSKKSVKLKLTNCDYFSTDLFPNTTLTKSAELASAKISLVGSSAKPYLNTFHFQVNKSTLIFHVSVEES